jgi:hypothetical protein
MPLKGFVCPLNQQNVTLEDCQNCPLPCDPLPLLATVLNTRKTIPGIYHVTEILNPRQMTYLTRKHDYYMPPDSMFEAALGTAWHQAIEKTIKEEKGEIFQGYISEKNFKVFINGVILSGTLDLADLKHLILWDFKTSGAYSVALFMENGWEDSTWDKYAKQTNIYRIYGFPEAKRIKLHVKIKGWDRTLANMDIKNKIVIDVPIMDTQKVKDFVSQRIADILEDEKTDNPPPCTKEEMWTSKKGEPKRCLEYCGGKNFCPQFHSLQSKNIKEAI